jgi:hypothetical protein
MATHIIDVEGSIDPAVKSTGGNEAADAGKLAIYNTEGQIQGSSNSSSLAAVKGTASGSGYGVHGESSSGTGVVGQSTTGNGVDASSNQKQAVSAINFHATEPVVKAKNANAANTADIAQFHRNNNQGLNVKNDGSLEWTSASGASATRTALGLGTAATQPSTAFDAAGSAAAAEAAAIAHADGLVVGLFDDRGNYDASGNAFPTSGGSGTAGAILKGDVWRISVAGTLGGNAVDVGDTIRALVDTPGQTAGNWATFEANVQQATETVRGTVAIATQAEAEDSGTTNDIDAITPKKWWQAFTSAFTAVGAAIRAIATPAATSWLRVNTDGTVTARTASETRTDLGLGTASTVDTGTGGSNVPTITQADVRYQGKNTVVDTVVFLPPGATIWSNIPAALTFFAGQSRWVIPMDLSAKTDIRLRVMMGGSGGSTNAKIRVLYKTQASGYSTTITDYVTVGSSEVQVTYGTSTNALITTSWIPIIAGAKADVFIALAGIDGDGVADPGFLNIYLETR